MAITRVHILKFIELALVIICLGLHSKTYTVVWTDYHEVIIPGAAFGGYFVILIVAFVGVFTGQPLNKRLDIIFSLVGCALYIASGAFAINQYEGARSGETRNYGLTKGSLAIINGVVFLIDGALSFRGE